ncbi:opacity protein-like surface antigen [Yoonia maricola]|uniref:Opacity protein-like surface antigen n=1 Tax=Yoonia maricola TaxID=420999 RepID=A0A2M8WM81_9RHOB|nr:porin family protein [Yoonia maricola]PJI92042.1 opacity protein-like surface antigen [Yoonia maricola]
MLKRTKARATFRTALKQTALAAVFLSPTVASADWSGGYAGLQLDALVGDDVFVTTIFEGIAVPEDSLEVDTVFSGFAGYQLQQGDFVIGGELAIGQANGLTADGFDSIATDARLIDIKARVGYDLGETLIYGVAGFSQSRLLDVDEEEDFLGLDLDTSTGVNYGFGVDYRITNQFTVGAEYLIRDLATEDEFDEFTSVRIDSKVESLGIRAAYNF